MVLCRMNITLLAMYWKKARRPFDPTVNYNSAFCYTNEVVKIP